ncbi:hypothetical protein ACTXT7_006612 [Hymenolepis weldensis]
MARGAFHHALIIPATFLSDQSKKPGNEAKRLRREALYDSEDLARHLANYLMNQIPTLSVSHISSKDIIAPDIWSDPFRVYACLFAKASRILFLVTQQDVDTFSDFITQLLQPLLKQAEALDYSWKSRFLIVGMGEFRLPDSLPCEVIRFREIGWFRDSMALYVLGKKIQEFWTPIYDTSDSIAKTEKLRFVTNVEETETFEAFMYVKNIMDEGKTIMQKNDEENISMYGHESAPGKDDNLPFTTSQNFSFRIDIESDRLLDINELLFSNNSLSGLHGIMQPYSVDSRYFSSRSEIGFAGSSSDTEDGPLVSDEVRSTSDSVGEMRWSSPDSVSIVQEVGVNVLPSPSDDEHTITTNDQEDTSIPDIVEKPKIEAPKPAKRRRNGSSQIKDQQTDFSKLKPQEVDVLSPTKKSPTFVRKSLADMPLEAIQERSAEEDGTAYQNVSEIQGGAELPHSTESETKSPKWRKFSSSDLPAKESTGYQLELESPHLEERDEKSEGYSVELMKSPSVRSQLPLSMSEATDEFNRSDEQKLFIANDRTSGYNTLTSIGGRFSQSGLSALDQRSFHSPREEITISEEPESVSQSPVSYSPNMIRRGLNIELRNQSSTDDGIKKNDSMSSKVSDTRTSSEKSQSALRTKAGGGCKKQETLTSFSIQADLLTQSQESKTDMFTTVTNLDDEYLSDRHVEQFKLELAVPISSDLREKSDSNEALPEPVNADTECGMMEKLLINEPASPENENKDSTTIEWFISATTTDNTVIPENITKILPETESTKEEGNSSSIVQVITKQEVSELLSTKDENASAQPTQAFDRQSAGWNTRERISTKEAVQFTKSEMIHEKHTVKDSQAPTLAKNTFESESNQQHDAKTCESMPIEITETTINLDSTATPNVLSTISVANEGKSEREVQNQETSEKFFNRDLISTTKQITLLDDVSITSSPRMDAELRRKNDKETVLLTEESFPTNEKTTYFENRTASKGVNGNVIGEKPEETLSELSSKENPEVSKKGNCGNKNLVHTDSTKVNISKSRLSQEIKKDISQTESDERKSEEEKLPDEINPIAPDLNTLVIKRDKEEELLQDKKNESHLDIPLDRCATKAIETAHLTSSIPAEDELSETDTKLTRKEASTISGIPQKSVTNSFGKSFITKEMTTMKRMESKTDIDANIRMNKSETQPEEEKNNKPAARDQAKLDGIKHKNFLNIPIVTGKEQDGMDMGNENKLKEATDMMRGEVEEIQSKSNGIMKPENVLHLLTDAPKYDIASSKSSSISSDKQPKRVSFQGNAAKSAKMVEQGSRYSSVNEETPQHLAKNIPIQTENSDHEYTAVPLRQVSVASASLPLIFIRKSTVEQTTKVIERGTWRTNAEPRSQRSENNISVEKSSTDTSKQPTTVTVKVNTKKESPEPVKQIEGQEIEIVNTKTPTANTTPSEPPWEEIGEDTEKDNKKREEEMEIVKFFDVIKKDAVENAQLGKFPLPLKCASPFSDSDCDPEITSWTMARPWYLSASGKVVQSQVPPVIAPRTKSAVTKFSSPADKNDQKGNKQSNMLTPKFCPASVGEAMKTEAAPMLRRNAEKVKARTEHRFSSISISDGEEQKPVEVVDAETGSTSSRSRGESKLVPFI